MKKLVLDIETAPLVVYSWDLWPKAIPMTHIVGHARTLMVGYQWVDDPKDCGVLQGQPGEDYMLAEVWSLLDRADAVIHYNGTRFDIPHLHRGFLEHDMGPPAPFHEVDLWKTVRRHFNFPSNKLDYVAQRLGIGAKQETGGIDLWKRVLDGDQKAWKKMADYCLQDVKLTTQLYHKLLAWIPSHPNAGLYADPTGKPTCHKCGSVRMNRRGVRQLRSGVYARYRCMDCGSWARGRHTELPVEAGKNILV